MVRLLRWIKNNPEANLVSKWLVQSTKNTIDYAKQKNKVDKQEQAYNNMKDINNNLATLTPREARNKWLWKEQYSVKALQDAVEEYQKYWVPSWLRWQAPYANDVNSYNAYRMWKTLPDLDFSDYKSDKSVWQYFKDDANQMLKEIKDYLNVKASYDDLSSIPVEQRTVEQQKAKDRLWKNVWDAKNNLRISL